jgi:hypothetical protein
MPAKEVAKQDIRLGEEIVIEGASLTPPFGAVFEDDGESGCFYALDTTRVENPILDSLHIYYLESVTDRQLPLNAAREDMMLNSVRGNVIRARTTLIAAAMLVADALLLTA